jgi:signal transduction histidine kinase
MVTSRLQPGTKSRPAPEAWLPLGFVVVALILLLGTPLVVSYRVRQVRNNLSDVADEARLVVSEFQAGFAAELARSRESSRPNALPDSIRSDAARIERQQRGELDSLVGRLGGEALERFIALRTAEERWRATNQSPQGAAVRDDGRDVLSSAAALDRYLFTISTQARAQVRGLERVNVYSAVALAPVALIAVGIVFMLDRRMRAFAHEADDRAEKLKRSVEQRATLIRGVTHDIKNPLGAASGYAELLEDGVAGPMTLQQTEMVRRFKRLVATALQTVAELVDLARVDVGDLSIDRHETDIVAIVRGVVDDYQASSAQKGLALTLEVPGEAIVITTDPAGVRHVLENLVSNAIKYTPEGGAISVAVSVARAEEIAAPLIRVGVRDNGPGIPMAFRDRVFDEFFRVPSTESDAPGSGLGLAISRRIARQLGGDVTLGDAPGHGSVFTLSLPMDRSTAEASRRR